MDIYGRHARNFNSSPGSSKVTPARQNKAESSSDVTSAQGEHTPFNYKKQMISDRLARIYEEIANNSTATPTQQLALKKPEPEKLMDSLKQFLEQNADKPKEKLSERQETLRDRLDERLETPRERLQERTGTGERRQETLRDRLDERLETPRERLQERSETGERRQETLRDRLDERLETPRERLQERTGTGERRQETLRDRLYERLETPRERLQERTGTGERRQETLRDRLDERLETPRERLQERSETGERRQETLKDRLDERLETPRERLQERTGTGERRQETLKDRLDERLETPRERLQERSETGERRQETLRDRLDERLETPRERLQERSETGERRQETLRDRLYERPTVKSTRREELSESRRDKLNKQAEETGGTARERTDMRKNSGTRLSEALYNELSEKKIVYTATGMNASFLLKVQDMMKYLPKEVRTLLQSCLSRCLLNSAMSSETGKALQYQGKCHEEMSDQEMSHYIREICNSGADAEEVSIHLEKIWNVMDNYGLLRALQTLLFSKTNLPMLFQVLTQALNFSKSQALASQNSEADERQDRINKDKSREFLVEAIEDSPQNGEQRKGKKQYRQFTEIDDDESDSSEYNESEETEPEDEETPFPFKFFFVNASVSGLQSSESTFEEDEDKAPAGNSPSYLLWYYMYLLYERIFSRGLPYAQFTSAYTESTLKDSPPAEEAASRGFLWFMQKSPPKEKAVVEQRAPELFSRKLVMLAEEKFDHDYMTLCDENFQDLSHDDLMNDPEYRQLFEFINS